MNKRFKLSGAFVRTMLASHSILGLTVAALLYLVCVTGTLSVFYPQIERWEQPAIAETATFDPATIDAAIATALEREGARPEHVFVTLPTDEVPRVSVHAGETSGFVRANGDLGEPVNHEWTHFLVALHYALSLPSVFGLTLVGVIGIMLTAMIISGLLAHPNIFKDAFSFRVNGPSRLQQVDIHNRLSVWTSPFQLAIALTGAFIGLAQVLAFAFAAVFYGGDTEALTKSLFLQHAEPTGVEAPLARVGPVLERFSVEHPDQRAMSVTIHEPGTTAQAIEIGSRVPRRLVWGEFHLYDPAGQYLGNAGWSSGDLGVQLYASTYRLHFGHFAGVPLQLAYLVLGIAMCIVVATGVNIWLLRRVQAGRPARKAQQLWTTTIWGTLFALGVSALGDALLDLNGTITFWLALAALLIAGWRVADVRTWSRRLRLGTAALCASVVIAHVVRFGLAAFNDAALTVNLLWVATALAMFLSVVLNPVSSADAGDVPDTPGAARTIESA